MELKKILYKTVHRKAESVEEIADRVGCSASLLYRCANINDAQARFPLEKLLPLMRATGDYSILKHLASRSGFILYKLPAKIKPKKIADLNEYQGSFTDAFRALLDFKKGKITKKQCPIHIDKFLSQTIGLKKGVEGVEQMTFFEEE